MVLRVALACSLLAGCGRLDFDETGDDLGALELEVPMFQTSSTSFVDVPASTLTLPASQGTSWLLLTTGALESPTLDAESVEMRYLLDGVEAGMGGTQTSTPGHPGPWQSLAVIAGTDRPQTITYQLRDASGAGGTLAEVHAIAIPLPPEAIRYGASDPPHDVLTAASTLDTQLSFGPLSGDYLFMLLVDATDAPGNSDCYVEWHGPSDELWLGRTHQPRASWQSYFTVHRATLDVANAIVSLYTDYGSSGPSQVADIRALAIRTDAFASVDYSRSDVSASTTSATPMTTLTLAPAPSAARQLLHLESTQLDEDCVNTIDAIREVTFTVDATTTRLSHATDNCSYQASYGAMGLVDAAPQTLSIAFDSANGQVVEHLASELLLLGLR